MQNKITIIEEEDLIGSNTFFKHHVKNDICIGDSIKITNITFTLVDNVMIQVEPKALETTKMCIDTILNIYQEGTYYFWKDPSYTSVWRMFQVEFI
jgi:hypothetical protein